MKVSMRLMIYLFKKNSKCNLNSLIRTIKSQQSLITFHLMQKRQLLEQQISHTIQGPKLQLWRLPRMKAHLRMIHLFKRARKLVEISKSHISCGISLALSSKTSQLSSRLGQRALLPNDHHLFLPLLTRKSIKQQCQEEKIQRLGRPCAPQRENGGTSIGIKLRKFRA